MPVSSEDFIVYLSLLSDESNLRVMVPQSIKGGLLTGTSATLGGFCGGPVGLLVGGAFGGTLAAVSCRDRCENVKDLLLAMNRTQRTDLYNFFQDTLDKEFQYKNFTEFNCKIERNLDLKHVVLSKFKSYIQQKMNLQIYDPRIKSASNR